MITLHAMIGVNSFRKPHSERARGRAKMKRDIGSGGRVLYDRGKEVLLWKREGYAKMNPAIGFNGIGF